MELLKVLPGSGDHLTPREIVAELDKYIVGQKDAKRSVAIALRNRWRRQQVPEALRDEIAPKNIIMIGPTGVGKTEIARRLAKLAQSPFLKIEATKFTEVGYVGRDVESMVRDLMELAVNMVKAEERDKVQAKADEAVEERLLDLLLPGSAPGPARDEGEKVDSDTTREKLRTMLRAGRLEDRFVELEVSQRTTPVVEIFSAAGMEEMDFNFKDMLGNIFPGKTKQRKVKVSEARECCSRRSPAASSTWTGWWRRPGARWSSTASSSWTKSTRSWAGTTRGPGRLPGRGAAGPAAHRRRHHGDQQVRHGAHRPHPVHRLRGLSPVQALGPDPGDAGPLPHPGGAPLPGGGGVRAHPHGAGERPDQAVPGPAGHGRHPAHLHRRRPSRRSPPWPPG